MTIKEQLLQLTRQLFPTGRAFRIPYGSIKESVEKAYIESEARAYNDAMSILDTILPDNDNFTAENATRWEQRLGMITNESVSLEDRKAAIKRKMNHPGDILARQSWDYIQNSLQSAGFNVWIHPNPNQIPPSLLVTPLDEYIAYHANTGVYHANTGVYHGNLDSGSVFQHCIANSIDEEKDYFFNVGQNLSCTFFVGGETLGTFADISNQRKQEFRQLILKLKPTKTVGFLFINYT